MTEEIERLRAELAVANVRLDDAMRNKDIITDWYEKASAERDALRAQLDEAREVVAEAVQWLRVSDLPCEMTISRADAVLEASASANGDDSDA